MRLGRHALAVLAVVPLLVLAGGRAEARAGAKKKAAAAASAGGCADSEDKALWWSPVAPVAGATIKLLAVGEEDGAGELSATDPAGAHHALAGTRHPGVPGSLAAELTAPKAGTYRVTWTRGDKTLACRVMEVA
ncbi:MAG TPA: hypothetical protein VGP64_18135, partial [Polyangia bacterium]